MTDPNPNPFFAYLNGEKKTRGKAHERDGEKDDKKREDSKPITQLIPKGGAFGSLLKKQQERDRERAEKTKCPFEPTSREWADNAGSGVCRLRGIRPFAGRSIVCMHEVKGEEFIPHTACSVNGKVYDVDRFVYEPKHEWGFSRL